MPKQSRAQNSGKEVSNPSAKARGFGSSSRLLENASRRQMDRRDALKVGIGGLFGLLLTGNAKADERVARADVASKQKVEYETFSDPKELEPYFKNAESMRVSIKPGEVKQIGEFEVRINNPEGIDPKYGTEFGLKDPNGEKTRLITSPLSDMNILEVDMGENHSYFKGKIAIFADESSAFIAAVVPSGYVVGALGTPREGKMREGPIRTGIGMDGDTLLVICSPKHLREGDVVYQAQVDREGNAGVSYYKYTTSKPAGTMIASL